MGAPLAATAREGRSRHMTKQQTAMRPLAYRLLAWGNERFGPAPILLYFLLYLVGILYARAIAGDRNPSVSTLDVVAFSAVFGYFLLVRVLDEHKDYDKDCINFPDRVLQRGLVTLDQLRVIGALTLVPQILVSMLVDGGIGPVTLAWLLLFGWTMLMLKEFFAREWLEPKLVLYAITHVFAGPLALIWIALIGADGKHLPASVGWLALMAFLVGATLEVGRKLHAPEDERETVASYTKSFGGPGPGGCRSDGPDRRHRCRLRSAAGGSARGHGSDDDDLRRRHRRRCRHDGAIRVAAQREVHQDR